MTDYDFQSNFKVLLLSLELNRLVLTTAGTPSLQSMGSGWRDLQKVMRQFLSCLFLKMGWKAAIGFSSLREHRLGMTELIICLLEYRLHYF